MLACQLRTGVMVPLLAAFGEHKDLSCAAGVLVEGQGGLAMSGVEGADKSDLLAGNARYKKLADLNEGTFGVVMLALDRRTNEQVCLVSL